MITFFKKFIAFFWRHRRQFIKYALTGCMSFALDYGAFFLLYKKGGLWYLAASALSQSLGTGFNFTVNRFWSFRAFDSAASRQLVRYILLQMFNYAFAIIMLYALVEFAHIQPMFAKILAIACMVTWNFILYKKFVYKNL